MWKTAIQHVVDCDKLIQKYLPFSTEALPPAAAASNDVPLTVIILTGSVDFRVWTAFPGDINTNDNKHIF